MNHRPSGRIEEAAGANHRPGTANLRGRLRFLAGKILQDTAARLADTSNRAYPSPAPRGPSSVADSTLEGNPLREEEFDPDPPYEQEFEHEPSQDHSTPVANTDVVAVSGAQPARIPANGTQTGNSGFGYEPPGVYRAAQEKGLTAEPDPLQIERVLATLRRRWFVIVLVTALVAGTSFALSVRQHKQYTATTSVVFTDSNLNQQASGLPVLNNSPSSDPQIMATDIQLLTQQAGVGQDTARLVGHSLSASDVANAVSVAQQGQTNVANVSATSASPSVAAAIANTYTDRFIASQRSQQRASVVQALNLVRRQIAALSPQQLSGTTGQALLDRAESLRILAKLQDGGVRILKPATVPTSPSSPKVLRNTVLGLMVGLLLGLGIAFLLDRLDRRMRNVEDLEAAYRLPILAAVPYSKSYAIRPQDASPDGRADTEVFKLLRAYLRYFNVDRELKLLLIASGAPGDGKSTVARNLAQAAQETGTKTLLLEADLRRPTAAKNYHLHPTPGLAEVLIGGTHFFDTNVLEAIQSVPIATRVNGRTSEVKLDVLVAGHPPPNPAEIIESHAMATLLAWAAENYELVVVDTPPIAVVSDAIPLLQQVDGVVVVGQVGKNSRDAAALLRERLVGVNAPLLGIVANGVKTKSERAYGYSYGSYGAAS